MGTGEQNVILLGGRRARNDDTVKLPPFERREFRFEFLEGFRGLFSKRLFRLPHHVHHGGISHRHYGVVVLGDEYRTCVAIDPNNDPLSLPHPTWTLPTLHRALQKSKGTPGNGAGAVRTNEFNVAMPERRAPCLEARRQIACSPEPLPARSLALAWTSGARSRIPANPPPCCSRRLMQCSRQQIGSTQVGRSGVVGSVRFWHQKR
jgi:hypothetical protein